VKENKNKKHEFKTIQVINEDIIYNLIHGVVSLISEVCQMQFVEHEFRFEAHGANL